MKRNAWMIALALALVGCSESSGGSDLSKEEEKHMDKLFREGIKPGGAAPTSTPTRGTNGQPINAPTD